ncbi:MAG TPA: acyl-CoA dehydrogenase [Longimicrobiales bacterium]
MSKEPGRAATGELPVDAADWPEPERSLLPFVPMIYIAWADGVLTPAEIDGIREVARRQPWLTDPARARLDQWLDPAAPPPATRLHGLLLTMRRVAAHLPSTEPLSLAHLGAALARAGGNAEWELPQAQAALGEVEAALGVVGTEALREILADERVAAVREAEAGASFDAAAMNRFIEGDRRNTRKWVFGILSAPEFRQTHDLGLAEYRERVWRWCRVLAERGLGGAGFPPEYGGGGDIARSVAIFETIAFHDLSLLVKYGVHFGLFGGSIYFLGTRRHHEAYLRDVISMRLPGCYAMTETGHGSNVRDLETTATYDAASGEFIIHSPTASACKDWIGNAALHGRMAVVFAQLEAGGEQHGVHAFLVPLRTDAGKPCAGVHIEDCGHKAGLNGVDNGRIRFDHVRIPRENLLDRFGAVAPDGSYSSPIPSPSRRFFTMLGTLVIGRISIAAAACSAGKVALTIATRYAARRRQFGPAGGGEVPILDYLTMRRRLIPRIATTYALDFALYDLTRTFAARVGGDLREVEVLAAGLKAFSSRHTVETVQACREACGGQGYLSSNRLGTLKADTDVFTTFEGDNAVLLQLVARGLLTEYREELGELKVWGIARHLARRAATRLAELNPITARRTDEEHLRDPEFHGGTLRYRETRLLVTAARRLKHRIDQGCDSFEALNQTQDHLVALARAHIERVVFDRFREAIERCDTPSLREVLERLGTLYALDRIERDAGWFLASGIIEAGKARAIRTLVNRLCAELRPDAVALVDAFGIPDAVLQAPIATS